MVLSRRQKVPISASGRPKLFFHGKTKVVELAEISILPPLYLTFSAQNPFVLKVTCRPLFRPAHVVSGRS